MIVFLIIWLSIYYNERGVRSRQDTPDMTWEREVPVSTDRPGRDPVPPAVVPGRQCRPPVPCELLPVLPSSQQTSVTDTREVAGTHPTPLLTGRLTCPAGQWTCWWSSPGRRCGPRLAEWGRICLQCWHLHWTVSTVSRSLSGHTAQDHIEERFDMWQLTSVAAWRPVLPLPHR